MPFEGAGVPGWLPLAEAAFLFPQGFSTDGVDFSVCRNVRKMVEKQGLIGVSAEGKTWLCPLLPW